MAIMGSPQTATSMTRRAVIGATLAAGAGALLWPYTPKSRVDVPQGRVELQYWEKWTGIEGVALQKVVKRFNESQGRIWVHLVPVSDIASKAMVAIGGGDPPDVVGLYTYNVPGYAEARAVMPLDEFKGFRGGGRLADAPYLSGIRDLLHHEGRQWAGVNTCYTLAMYYNRALLRSIGHDPDKPPRMVSALDALSAKLTVFDESHTRIERAGFLPNIPPGWWSYFWPTMFGGKLYDTAADRALIASPECVACFEWLSRTAKTFGPGPTTAFANGYGRNIHSAQDPFISGAMAMMVQGPWLANFIRDAKVSLDYAAAPVPVADSIYNADEPTGMLEADVLMIPRGCPHPEEAFAFVLFMQRQDVQEELSLAHCKPSPFVRVSDGFYEQHKNPSIRAFDAIVRSPRVQVLPRTTSWKAYADLINTAFDAVWMGADPKGTLVGVQTRAQQLLDAAAARRQQRRKLAGGGA
jgi:multiple sugar transport system substrate-binding protein